MPSRSKWHGNTGSLAAALVARATHGSGGNSKRTPFLAAVETLQNAGGTPTKTAIVCTTVVGNSRICGPS